MLLADEIRMLELRYKEMTKAGVIAKKSARNYSFKIP